MPASAKSKSPDPSKSKDDVSYYPPGYREKNWGPATIPLARIRAVASASVLLRLSAFARKYLLANALVEGREDFGVISDFLPRTQKAALAASGCLSREGDASAHAIRQDSACRYAASFDFKTGPYAEHVYGENVSTSHRISIWNGKGVKRVNGKVVESADHHAEKVLAMHKALANPENKPLLDAYKTAGGIYEP